MPPRSWRVRIEDILDAIDNIEHYVAGLDFDAFDADRKTVDAVERNLEIIGEATANLPDEVLARWPEVPWRYMKGVRNLLAHEYFGVDERIPHFDPNLCNRLGSEPRQNRRIFCSF